jgi:uncharacterized protein YecT (DUF1311 family)
MKRAFFFGIVLTLAMAGALAQTTYELRLEADEALKQADAALNEAYKAAMASLDDTQKEALKRAQRAWIPYRDAAIAAEASLYAGGTLEGVAATEAAVAIAQDQASLLRALLAVDGPADTGDCDKAEESMRQVYDDYLATAGDDAEMAMQAQAAWAEFRGLFLQAVEQVPGSHRPDAFCATLALARAERLKALFPEGYEPVAEGGSPSAPVAVAPSPAPAPPVSAPTASTPPEGVPVIKGLYVGMPLREAGQVMHGHELVQRDYVNPDGSLNWDRLISKDYQGDSMIEMAEGMLMVWRITADANERVTKVHFIGPVSARLFNARDMTGEEFAQAFVEGYRIDRMEVIIAPTDITTQILTDATQQLGWQKTDREHGWRITLHDDKTLIYEAIATAAETAFD